MTEIITERPQTMSYEDYRSTRDRQKKEIKNYLKGRLFYPSYIEVYWAIPKDKRYKKLGPHVNYKEIETEVNKKPKAKYEIDSKYVSSGIPYKK